MTKKVVITYEVQADGALKAIKQVNKEVGETETQAGKSKKGLEGFAGGLSGMIGPALTAGAAIGAIKTAIDWAEQGIEIQKGEIALVAYAGGANEAERAMQACVTASSGLLSNFEATQAASKFLAMGLADGAKGAGELTEMAVTLGTSMKMEAQPAIENFALMLANNSIPRMDSYGLSADKARVRMKELAKLYPSMTLNQRFLTAVQEQGAEKLKQLADAGFEAGDSLSELDTIVENLGDEIKVATADAMEPLLQYLLDIATIAADAEANVGDLIEETKGLMDEPIAKSWHDFLRLLGIFEGDVHDSAEEIRQADQALKDWNTTLMTADVVVEGLGLAVGDLEVATEDLTEAQYLQLAAEAVLAGNYELAQYYVDLAENAERVADETQDLINLLDDLNGKKVSSEIWLTTYKSTYDLGLRGHQQVTSGGGGGGGTTSGTPTFATWADAIAAGYVRQGGQWVKEQAGGGPLAPIAKVGEAGWEYIINGIVIPHDVSKRIESLGMGAGRGLWSGGPLIDGTVYPGWSPPTTTGISPAVAGYITATEEAVDAAKARGSFLLPGMGTRGGAPATTTQAAAEVAAEIAAEATEEAVTGAVVRQIQPEVTQQTIALTSEQRAQRREVQETNALLAQVVSLLQAQPDEDTMRQIMVESQDTSGF